MNKVFPGSVFQDFSMDFGHCPEITAYTGCCLFPAADQLATLWAENKKSLLSMLVEVELFYQYKMLFDLVAYKQYLNVA